MIPSFMEEIWKSIVGFDGLYEVSNLGRVRSLDRSVKHKWGGGQFIKGRVLRPGIHRDGHVIYGLHSLGRCETKRGGPLVLEAFVGPRPNGFEACHNDGNPANDALSNLRWGTHSDNEKDKLLHGTSSRGENNSRAKLTAEQVLTIRNQSGSHHEIAAQYGISRPTVSFIKSRRYWSWL